MVVDFDDALTVIAAVGAFILAVVAIVKVHRDRVAAEASRPVAATAITADFRDLTLRVDRRAGRSEVVHAVAPLSPHTDAPAAPLMDWRNDDVRTGSVMTWCLKSLEPTSAAALRRALDELARRFPTDGSRPGVRWKESCPGAYTTGNTADTDCPGVDAVACAVYYGPRNGRVSISQTYLNRYGHLSGWREVAIAHEVQHIVLNLGHNPCGVIRDPDTGRPVPSVMTPVDLIAGQSCSDPPARWLTPDDWYWAVRYYRLDGGQGGGGGGDPSPSPSPSPTPTPTPTPTAATVQLWAYPGEGAICPVPLSGEWCVVSIADAPRAWWRWVYPDREGPFQEVRP
jgi:hypothetical protein